MSPVIDPRVVRAKRFPVHAAVDRCNEAEVRRLLDEDAGFHLGRKVSETDLSVVHTACSMRQGNREVMVRILQYLVQLAGAPINDLDASGQSPLHYAVCHKFAEDLVPILIRSKCSVDVHRSRDLWTPLHLAVMLGKREVVRCLVVHGEADVTAKGGLGETPSDLAVRYRMLQLSDFLASPRKSYRPPSKSLPELFDDLNCKVQEASINPLILSQAKFKEEEISWRDECGNSLLHIAAWNGDLGMSKAVFDNVKARKLVTVVNAQGATPLALAIIAGQDEVVEEFFTNKHSKKLIELHSTLRETKQNIVHLMLQYAPFFHPKLFLKRKDLTKDVLNALDADGLSPLLGCAVRKNVAAMNRIFANKNAKGKIKSSEEGRSVLWDVLGPEFCSSARLQKTLYCARNGPDLPPKLLLSTSRNHFRRNPHRPSQTLQGKPLPEPTLFEPMQSTPLTVALTSWNTPSEPVEDMLLDSMMVTLLESTLEWPPGPGRENYWDLRFKLEDSSWTVLGIHASVPDGNLLDLSIKDKTGRNILHHTIENQDFLIFKHILDRTEFTADIAAEAHPVNQETPLLMCLKNDQTSAGIFISEILRHPTANSKFSLDKVQGSSNQSILHLLAERGKLDLWRSALECCDVNARDADGNTPLMKVVSCGRFQMAESCLQDPRLSARLNVSVKNNEGNTLLMLCIQHMDDKLVNLLVGRVNVGSCINEVNNDCNTALLLAASAGKWTIVQCLLENEALKGVDIHKANKEGMTCLVLLLLARLKLSRLEQNHILKKEQDLAKNVRTEYDSLWSIVKLILDLEKDFHGPTVVHGRDGGKACLKKQMSASNLIRAPTWDSVTSEFGRLYMVQPRKKNSLTPINVERQESLGSEANSSASPQAHVNGDTKKPFNNSSDKIPKITLDDLRDPAAFEAMVNSVTSQIASEKKKIKAKSPSKRSSVAAAEHERGESVAAFEPVMNGELEPSNLDSSTEVDKDLCPTAAPRRRASFRKKSTDEKPPIPDGPSPPPPEEKEDARESKFKFSAAVKAKIFAEETVRVDEENVAPKRNEVKDHESSNVETITYNGINSSSISSDKEAQTATLGPSSIGTGADKIDVCTQTDFELSSNSIETQTCCCTCHKN